MGTYEQSRLLKPEVEQELIRLAKEKAAEYKLPTEGTTTKVVQEGDSWVVEFHPTNTSQFGGGGRFWFRVKGREIDFEKWGRWE